jgi:AdoMet-dependent rRNA methyltransferase SPB1
VRALREKQRALDARPIKKVAEAKARKKLKAAQRLEKAMKKAEGVNQTADMTEREKASQIEKLMKKGMGKGKKKNDIKVVVAKGPNKGIKGRPKGVKGRYKIVDARMRKEVGAGSYRAVLAMRLTLFWVLGPRRETESKGNEEASQVNE